MNTLPRLPCYLNGDFTELPDAKISVMDRIILDQLHRSFQLTWAAVQVCSGGAYAAMASQRFQNMDGSAFVGQVC